MTIRWERRRPSSTLVLRCDECGREHELDVTDEAVDLVGRLKILDAHADSCHFMVQADPMPDLCEACHSSTEEKVP